MSNDVEPATVEKPTVATVPGDAETQPRRVVTGNLEWRQTFSAFQHRNYRLFFGGQFISLVGTWMQMVAEGWLVYKLSSSTFVLGLVRFLNTFPVTLFALAGGAIADRVNKRRILIATQTVSMVLAFTLFALVGLEVVKVWQVALLGLCLGLANAFDIPARQSFVVEMVGKEHLMNAIALNSSMFNGSRVFGPALAGVLIGLLGIASCFFINGLSFLAVIAGYLLMRFPKTESPKVQHESIREATMTAIRYVAGHRVLRAVMILVSVVSLFGLNYSVLMPAFARDVLHVQAAGYGYLLAANGLGAFLGAITLAALGNYPRKRLLVFGGLFGFSVMIAAFALSRNLWLSSILLVCAGWFQIIFFATANTLVQLRSPDELRGRMMGIYSFCFIGLSPFGSLLTGGAARIMPASTTIVIGATICILAGLITMWLVPPQPQPATGESR